MSGDFGNKLGMNQVMQVHPETGKYMRDLYTPYHEQSARMIRSDVCGCTLNTITSANPWNTNYYGHAPNYGTCPRVIQTDVQPGESTNASTCAGTTGAPNRAWYPSFF